MNFERISDDIPPQIKILNMVNPNSNALLHFPLKLECCKPHKVACHPTKCYVINDVKQFLTVYRMIYSGFSIKIFARGQTPVLGGHILSFGIDFNAS